MNGEFGGEVRDPTKATLTMATLTMATLTMAVLTMAAHPRMK